MAVDKQIYTPFKEVLILPRNVRGSKSSKKSHNFFYIL